MDKKTVVIVGAGIPGIYAARELAKNNFKVILVEQNPKKGEPNYSSAIVPTNIISEFLLPKDGIASVVN